MLDIFVDNYDKHIRIICSNKNADSAFFQNASIPDTGTFSDASISRIIKHLNTLKGGEFDAFITKCTIVVRCVP